MAVLGEYLYAGTENYSTGGQVWRTPNGTDWSQANLDGFGITSNTAVILGEEAFNGYLYAGTGNSTAGGEIWRCAICDGTDWWQVVNGGFGDGANRKVDRIVGFAGNLYAVANNDATGAEVWKSPTGERGSWTQCNVDGFGDGKNTGLWAVTVFDGHLYAAPTQGVAWNQGTHTGVEVWRTHDGVTWTQVNADGFGDRDNYGAKEVVPFDGSLYVSTLNRSTGTQIWRCATCDGTNWTRVVGDGFGDRDNTGARVSVFEGRLYAGTDNRATGVQVWRTSDGTSWSQVNGDGFGDSNNFWDGSLIRDKGQRYLWLWQADC
jgi:hypothetical protein